MRHSPFLDALADFLSSRLIRAFLAVLIIVSVLPYPELEARLRPLFLGIFGLELLGNFLLLATGWRHPLQREQTWLENDTDGIGKDVPVEGLGHARLHRPPPRGIRIQDLAFLVVDALAFISFLPLHDWLGVQAMDFLTPLRLVRLLVLIRFLRTVFGDIYAIVVRRERFQQFAQVTLSVLLLTFVSAVVLVQLEIPHDYNGDPERPEAFPDLLWWSFRQLESADNLVPSLSGHPILIVLSLLMTITGVFVISFIIGLGSSVVEQLFKAEQRRPVPWSQHSLVVGPVEQAEVMVREFVRIYNKHRALQRLEWTALWEWVRRGGPRPRRHALPHMTLLGRAEGAPSYLQDPLLRKVMYREGDASHPSDLVRAGAPTAKRTIFLADRSLGRDADGVTLLGLAAFRTLNPTAHVFVEVTDSASGPLMLDVGGRGTFPLDVPRFLGLFLCQHLIVPGIEGLYRDLLTAEGSEFYTHLYVDPAEQRLLRQVGGKAWLPFEALARQAWSRFGVTLLGVYLSDEPPVRLADAPIPTSGLFRWVNPMLFSRGTTATVTFEAPCSPETLVRLGASPGFIPVWSLAGLIAISESYVPLQRFARVLLLEDLRQLLVYELPLDRGRAGGLLRDESGHALEPRSVSFVSERQKEPNPPDGALESQGEAAASVVTGESSVGGQRIWQSGQASPLLSRREALLERLLLDDGDLHRILIVGYSAALPFFLEELSAFIPGIEVILTLNVDGLDSEELGRRLESLPLGLTRQGPLPGEAGESFTLVRGGRLTLFTTDRPGIADFAARCLLRRGAVDAAVFLSEPEAQDRDARTAIRLMRFARALESHKVPLGERIHLLAEFVSIARGHNIKRQILRGGCGFPERKCVRLTLVSTELIRNYFMVHSAFVPGVTELYDELLNESGQELLRLDVMGHGGLDAESLTLGDIMALLMPEGILPVGVELKDGQVLLNTGPDESFDGRQVLAIFCVADGQHAERRLRVLGQEDSG